MFFAADRDAVLDSITRLGASRCGYCIDSARWAGGLCDCKYGGPDLARPDGEKTGCPELRCVYFVVAAMTDAEWDDLRRRNGGITPDEFMDGLRGA